MCTDLQAVGTLEFFGELYSFADHFEGFWVGFREREGSIISNHQHFAISTGICGVSRVNKPKSSPILYLITHYLLYSTEETCQGK